MPLSIPYAASDSCNYFGAGFVHETARVRANGWVVGFRYRWDESAADRVAG
jgi:hypothetical protein